jgi:hypothetical protein
MGTYSMLNKMTEINDELLDLKDFIVKNHQKVLKVQEEKFKKLDEIYGDKARLNEVERISLKSKKNVDESVKRINKALKSVEKVKREIKKILEDQNEAFKKSMKKSDKAEKERRKTFKKEAVKHFEKLDKKIKRFKKDNSAFEEEFREEFNKLSEKTERSLKYVKDLNREFGADVKRRVDNIDKFTVSKLTEFYDAYKDYEKAMQSQVHQIDAHLKKRFTKEREMLDERLDRIAQVINQFYELYYNKVSKNDLRVYQRAIDEIEKRLERLESGLYARESENI